MRQLLSKKVKFVWSDRCDKAFEELKAMLQSAPLLTAPDFKSSFKLAVDANDVAAGAVLLQEISTHSVTSIWFRNKYTGRTPTTVTWLDEVIFEQILNLFLEVFLLTWI